MRRTLLALFLLLLSRVATADRLPWLHAQGTRIVDESGKTVLLRGINLGGWLVEEMWMMPFRTERLDEHKPLAEAYRSVGARK